MPRFIAVANLKGGAGKSTIAVNLAGELSGKKHSVILVDADAQGTSTYWATAGRLPFPVEALPYETARDVKRWAPKVLEIDADYVVIDCPPHVGGATEAAVGIADLVLIPVTASGADLAATLKALELVHQMREAREDGGPGVHRGALEDRLPHGAGARDCRRAGTTRASASARPYTSGSPLSSRSGRACGSAITNPTVPLTMTSRRWEQR